MSEQTPGPPAAILLIDDNPTDALLMKAVIERGGGFEVTTAADGDTGRALITSGDWVCAIVDLMLPGKDGIEVIQAGRKSHPDLPIMFITASSNETLIDAAFRAGADERLSKPIEPEDVLRRIDEHVNVGEPEHTPMVVALGACPGDLEMGCGGVLHKHREEGHAITIVNLAGGADPHSALAESARLAASLLEVEMTNMGEDTRHVADLDAATATLETTFEASKPGILYIPTASSDRPSSLETHRVALALAAAVPNVLAYQDPWATVDFKPQLFVDLAPRMERKLELVSVYEGLQLHNVSSELARATALFWGRFTDPVVAEPFEIIRRAGG